MKTLSEKASIDRVGTDHVIGADPLLLSTLEYLIMLLPIRSSQLKMELPYI